MTDRAAPRTEAAEQLIAVLVPLVGQRDELRRRLRDVEREAAAPALNPRVTEAVRACVGPWFEEGYEAGRLDAEVLAAAILARLTLPGDRKDAADD